MTQRSRVTHAFVALACLMWAMLLPATALAQSLRLDTGHVDIFYVTSESGGLDLALKEDVTGSGVIHTAEEVVLEVAEMAWTDATATVGGIDKPSYFLPQTQDPDLLWPGLDTQDAGREGFESVTFSFPQVSGPGEVFVFETVGFGDVAPVTDSESLRLASGESITQGHPAHRHLNWAFTQPGQYTMQVTATSDGVTSNTATYTWIVGDGQAPETEDAPQPTPDAALPEEAAAPAGDREVMTTTTTRKKAASASTAPKQRPAAKPDKESTVPEVSSAVATTPAEAEVMVLSAQQDSERHMLIIGVSVLGAGMLVLGLGIGSLTWLTVRRVREGQDL